MVISQICCSVGWNNTGRRIRVETPYTTRSRYLLVTFLQITHKRYRSLACEGGVWMSFLSSKCDRSFSFEVVVFCVITCYTCSNMYHGYAVCSTFILHNQNSNCHDEIGYSASDQSTSKGQSYILWWCNEKKPAISAYNLLMIWDNVICTRGFMMAQCNNIIVYIWLIHEI